jgi:hypothetical protein
MTMGFKLGMGGNNMWSTLVQKVKQLDKKSKIIAVSGTILILTAVIALAIVDNIQKAEIIDDLRSISSEYETRGDTISDILLKHLDYTDNSAEGFDLRNFDVEVLARSGDWVAIHAISLNLSNYGNRLYAAYQKQADKYVLKLSGSILSDDDYSTVSAPSEIVDSINGHMARQSDGRLREVLKNAPDKTYPIINALPIGTNFYQITYHFSDQSDINSFYLYVDAKYGYNNAAIFNLIKAGFDPADYKIVFNYDIVAGGLDGNT